MMRGPSYDDNYINRKMNSLQVGPTFNPPSSDSYGYMQENGVAEFDEIPKYASEEAYETSERVTSPLVRHGYVPSARTQLILNRVALSQPRGYSPAPPRLPPRMGPPPPSYYDYDYGYGGYGGYGGGYGGGYRPYGGYGYGYPPPPPPPMPRYRSYDPYVDEDYDLNYVPRYRPTRAADAIVAEVEKDKLRRSLSPTRTPTTTRITSTSTNLPSDFLAKHFSPGLGGEGREGTLVPRKSRPKSVERPSAITSSLDLEGSTQRSGKRYNTFSEPQMLQDQVDKMRTRLQAMSFSLDPSGPVPEIVVPERSRRVDTGKDFSKKYSSAFEMSDLPRLSSRRHHQYPEDDYMKDNLRIKCLSHYKTTRTAAEYWKPKGYYGDETSTYTLPSYSSKYSKTKASGAEGSAKWEEPDTVYSSSLKENKPFSQVESGSSFYSLNHGCINRKKDTVLEKVHDYYYTQDTKKSGEEDDDLKKERRKKKKSKERDEPLALDAAPSTATEDSSAAAATAATDKPAEPAAASEPSAPAESTEATTATTPAAAETSAEVELDEKERKRLEKKKRKAEREAAAKAAMEAELAALAEAEAELARLEAESSSLKTSTETKTETTAAAPAAAPAGAKDAPATDAKPSEKPAEKCESPPVEVPCDVCPPSPPPEFECDPTSFLPSSVNDAAEDLSGTKAEEPMEQFSTQDLSVDKVTESGTEPVEEQVNEPQNEPQVSEDVAYEPDAIVIETDDADDQRPVFKTETRLGDEQGEMAAEQLREAPVSLGDGSEQQIGGEKPSVEREEERTDSVADVLQGAQPQTEPTFTPEKTERNQVLEQREPEQQQQQQQQEQQQQPEQHLEQEQQQQEDQKPKIEEEIQEERGAEASESQQSWDDVDIFAGRDD